MAKVKPERLVDVERKKKPVWRGSQELVHVRLTKCPDCGERLDESMVSQLALPMLHGGYGADRTTVSITCPCGWYLARSTTETNPRNR